jgi:regulator of cell morphogenesis and NO signaling
MKMHEYQISDRMRDIIDDNSSLLMVMSRFGIPLGFGDKTILEICTKHNVDEATFISVANFFSHRTCDYTQISLRSLIDYLKRAHTYFLEFNLPTIRRRLIDAIDCSGDDKIAILILKLYDQYVTEVRKHMEYENDVVFGYVESLLNNKFNENYTISIFANKHNDIGSKLNELKDIIIRYYPERGNDMLNAVLFDIINCESDLSSHCQVEDQLFIPAVIDLENNLRNILSSDADLNEIQDDNNILSNREKEVIYHIAKGLTNKEIAEKLCLSIHTITTHRRNISTKLQIHSAAGLTIYALMNDIIKIQDIKPA